MKAKNFLSTPDDLVPAALIFGPSLKEQGFRVQIEPYEVGFPYTPVFSGKRYQTSIFLDVMLRLDLKRLEQWSRYAKSCESDTRIVIGLPVEAKVSAKQMKQLLALGIGVWEISGGATNILVPAQDLALQISPPTLPQKLKKPLGHSYELFSRGEWRGAFEAACVTFEQHARTYLKKQMSSRGINVVKSKAKGTVYSAKEIETMSMGQLANAFGKIDSPNGRDTRILQALEHINPDRITVAHYGDTAAKKEARLRKNVARNMFAILGGLKEIYNIKN